MIPFFVVDRPMSLNILKTSFVHQPELTFGLMTHAFVSDNFLRLFATFPCDDAGQCWLRSSSSCQSLLTSDKQFCPLGAQMTNKIIRMCDYGIFEKGGKKMTYEDLFSIYKRAGADFGIMQDVFSDSKATIESAKRALEEYSHSDHTFKLVLVAQGKTVDEYLRCYEELKKLGGQYIAIGGLLRKKERSVRYLHVGSDDEMRQVLFAVRKDFNPDWLFVLGAYHAERHEMFSELGVYGSDYKGWIFQYKHKRELVKSLHEKLAGIERGSRKSNLIHQAKSERDRLARLEKRLRLNYINTKNSSQENSIKKARIRMRLLRVQERLSEKDVMLLMRRTKIASQNGLPADYEETLKQLKGVFNETDQSIRIKGVHTYLETRVYNQCQTSEMKCALAPDDVSQSDVPQSMELCIQRRQETALIIPCGKAKVWHTRPELGRMAAKDVYVSPLFRLCRSFAERFFPNNWFIFSAHYGLIRPNKRISNYDTTFSNENPDSISYPSLRRQCTKTLSQYKNIISLCGKSYNLRLIHSLRNGQSIEIPMKSLGLFDRMRWLKRSIEEIRPQN